MPAPPTYPKRDFRRVLLVLAAIVELRREATLVRIVARTGLDNRSVTRLIAIAQEQFGVTIKKPGVVYRIVSWGGVIRPSGAMAALNPIRGKAKRAH